MIKSEREHAVTVELMQRFERSVDQLEHSPSHSDPIDPMMRQIQLAALRSQLDDLRAEAAEYEALRAGTKRRQVVEVFEDVSDTLIAGRIAAGLTQRQLAERLGLKEQQIQRYEATEYRSASLARVEQVVAALGLTFRGDVRFQARKANSAARR